MNATSKAYEESIDRKAAEWFGRREVGLSLAEEQEFQAWLEADERHAVHYGQFDDTWKALDDLKELKREPETAVPEKTRVPFFGRFRWAAASLAAAAAVAMAFYFWPHVSAPAIPVETAATDTDGFKVMQLPDGSVVHLNANSSVLVQYGDRERRVTLERGEAHFTVAKNPERPFVVTAGAVSVHAVGTAFNVRLDPAAVEVLVTEGKVRVDDAARGQSLLAPDAGMAALTAPDSRLLTTGERVVIPVVASVPAPAAPVTIAPEQIEESLAWQTKMLDFDMTPLGDVVKEFNRYNTHQLVIEDPILARRPFGGSFRADNYIVFVQFLEQRFGVVAQRSANTTILRSGK